jgi:hypothetical protein
MDKDANLRLLNGDVFEIFVHLVIILRDGERVPSDEDFYEKSK